MDYFRQCRHFLAVTIQCCLSTVVARLYYYGTYPIIFTSELASSDPNLSTSHVGTQHNRIGKSDTHENANYLLYLRHDTAI
jgi:hypothetical protein